MNLSKKLKVIIWAAVLLIVIFLGLESTFSYVSSASYTVYFYGIMISHGGSADLLWAIGEKKIPLIIATLLIGLTAVITSKKK